MMYAGGSPNFDMTGTREPQPLPQPAPMFQPLPQPPPLPQPYMGGFSFPFDQTLPAKSEALPAPAAQGVDSIMPVPVQDAPVTAPPVYDFAPLPQPPPFVEPPPFIPMIPSVEPPLPTYFEPPPFIPAPAPPVQDLFIEPAPEPVVPSPFVRPSRGMFGTGFR